MAAVALEHPQLLSALSLTAQNNRWKLALIGFDLGLFSPAGVANKRRIGFVLIICFA
jgi:hypothetical protein